MGLAGTYGSLQPAACRRRQPVLSNVSPIHLAPSERQVSLLDMSSGIPITVVIHEPIANQSKKLQPCKKRCSAAASAVHAMSLWHLCGMPKQCEMGSDLREVRNEELRRRAGYVPLDPRRHMNFGMTALRADIVCDRVCRLRRTRARSSTRVRRWAGAHSDTWGRNLTRSVGSFRLEFRI